MTRLPPIPPCPCCQASLSSLTYTGHCPSCRAPLAGQYAGYLGGKWIREFDTDAELSAMLLCSSFVSVFQVAWVPE
jgi:predicted amidophosphoribosyltransferase